MEKIAVNLPTFDIDAKTTCNTNVFSLPSEFWSEIIESVYFPSDPENPVKISEISANRTDYDYMKDLKQKIGNGKQVQFKTKNGDVLTVCKSKNIEIY